MLQARVDPEIREKAERGAAVRGVSLSRYMEILIQGDELADTYVPPQEQADQLDMTA